MSPMIKAVLAMIVFSVIVAFGMNLVGLDQNHRDPVQALLGAIVLLVALIGNVFLFLRIAGEAPFKWFKD